MANSNGLSFIGFIKMKLECKECGEEMKIKPWGSDDLRCVCEKCGHSVPIVKEREIDKLQKEGVIKWLL